MKIGYLNPEGTFGHEATEQYFGAQTVKQQGSGFSDNRAVVQAVADRVVTYGVAPVENSTEGAVGMTLDALYQAWEAGKPVYPCATVVLPVAHCLLGLSGVSLEEIQEIKTHPQAHGQCQGFLRAQLPNVHFVPTSSTAGGARAARDEARRELAAIASRRAGDLYGLDVLAADIHDRAENRTRFLILSSEGDHQPTGKDETLIVFSCAPDRPGSLLEVLKPLKEVGSNIHMITSRQRDLGHYHFFLGLEGHRLDAEIRSALEVMTQRSQWLYVLGSYPLAR